MHDLDEPTVAPLVLVSVVEENLHATLQLNTQHAFVGKGRTHERSSRPFLLLLFETRNDLRQKYRYKKRFDSMALLVRIGVAPEQVWLGLPKKNEQLVRIINTRHMPRRVDLHCTPSPVLLD